MATRSSPVPLASLRKPGLAGAIEAAPKKLMSHQKAMMIALVVFIVAFIVLLLVMYFWRPDFLFQVTDGEYQYKWGMAIILSLVGSVIIAGVAFAIAVACC